MICPNCGRQDAVGKFCQYCGAPLSSDARSSPMAFQPTQRYKPRSSKPTIAGVFLIIAAIDGMINWIGAAIILSSISYVPTEFVQVCATIGIIFGILTLIGGICAVTRKMWAMALIGSIFGLFTIGLMFEASLLSLIALILIATSKDEFS